MAQNARSVNKICGVEGKLVQHIHQYPLRILLNCHVASPTLPCSKTLKISSRFFFFSSKIGHIKNKRWKEIFSKSLPERRRT